MTDNPSVRFLAASAAGLAATAPMTAFMEASFRALPAEEQEPLPPRKITMKVADELEVKDELSEPQRLGATMAAHFAYGTFVGGGYGLIAPHIPLPPVAAGIVYGLGVWAGSYLGLLPALGLHRAATKEPAERNALMIGAHVVWGGVLGYLTHAMLADHDATPRPASNR